MSLFRYEVDQEGNRTEIQQIAYQTPGGVVVMDAGATSEEGWEVYVPAQGPTYQNELAQLTSAYQESVKAMNEAFSLAGLADGLAQEAKQAAIRDQYVLIKNQYSADKAALKLRFGV